MWRSFSLTAAAMIVLGGCAPLTIAWADLDGSGAPAAPPVFAAFAGAEPSAETWREEEAPRLRAAFEAEVYGAMPEASSTRIISHEVLDERAFNGAGRLEEYRIEAQARFNGATASTESTSPGGFIVDIVLPNGDGAPAPIILMETFCPRWSTIQHPKVSRPAEARDGDGGVFGAVANYVFGRYICTPPIEEILARGYGVAAIFPSEVVPDQSKQGLAALSVMAGGNADPDRQWGAIAAWGWIYSRVIDALEGNPRVDQTRLITWGHSRYGKSALVAAAYDPRIAGVIAHQSGTGGASLNRRKKGETVKSITANYPHWFSARYAAFAGSEEAMSVDQHQLLALIAPRPVLLGNARRDVWSDPNGAFRAAKGADPVYKLFGSNGLEQKTLGAFAPHADLSFWIRPGTHGVVKEDWPAFLEFLDAHFAPPGSKSETEREE